MDSEKKQLEAISMELKALKEEFAKFKINVEFELEQARCHSLTEEIHKVVTVESIDSNFP